jgi:hypothetical protein
MTEKMAAEGMIKLEKAGKEKSRGLFLGFQGKSVYDEESSVPVSGDRIIQGVVIRFEGGYLHGGKDPGGEAQPAVECGDAHTEWWEGGYLHREDGPAVISEFGDWEEYWNRGNLVSIFYRPADKRGGPA